ncbi:hypothetical protein BB558_001705 [Smittium angustum]|uniref:Glutamyl-tRNA(Gln) amidotransferase subunit B, mitochondrial n=1 Tax=Smittium angustum TaxID=133377 RepID=A0A2U1JAV1_SMIAN|nr:hypothetical protein BB558_001705 [Smittium angustum]
MNFSARLLPAKLPQKSSGFPLLHPRLFHLPPNYTTRNTNFTPVVGLEIHAQLKNNTKLFSASDPRFDQNVNSNLSLFDIAIPGSMPVLNKNVLYKAAKTVISLKGSIQQETNFQRKHYFYPDQPLGYQITQQNRIGGHLILGKFDGLNYERKIRIKQIQIEQDTAKTINDTNPIYDLIDYNRSGAALLEIVTEPDIRSAEEATLFLKKIILVLQTIESSKALMEEGSLRCDVNVSLDFNFSDSENKLNSNSLESFKKGPRVEIKNLNSLRSVTNAIESEIQRQISVLFDGGEISSETRSYDVIAKQTKSSRTKESKPDYRFMPEADIPTIHLSHKWIENIKKELPEFPDDKKNRLSDQYGLSIDDINVLYKIPTIIDFFEKVCSLGICPKEAYFWISGEIFRLINYHKPNFTENIPITPQEFGSLLKSIENSDLTSSMVKKILITRFDGDKKTIPEIISINGWNLIDNKLDLIALCKDIINNNPKQVEKYKSTKNNRLLGFFVGKVIAESKGNAKPQIVSEIIKQLLK